MKVPDLYKKKRYELLNSVEVCSLLGISLRTLYRMVKRGAVPAVKVGRTYRFRPAEIITCYETRSWGYPLCFRPEVLGKYLIRPIKKGQGGWIEIIELYRPASPAGRRGMSKDEGLIRYQERRRPDGSKVIVITKPEFNRLPHDEKIHFRRFEIT